MIFFNVTLRPLLPQVREKYPHLENRQVTKILGEWWADLPQQQKTSYTGTEGGERRISYV